MIKNSNPNRRHFRRAMVAFAVKQVIGGRTVICQANDISTDGIFMASVMDELFQLHGRCRLEFTLPGTEILIQALGRIVRQQVNGRYHLNAVKFAALAPSHRRLIERYVAQPLIDAPQVPPFLPPTPR
jgi:hypothetical protein